MKNAFLKKIISAGVAMATIGTLAPLGVSAQWRQSTDSTWSYVEGNSTVTGWKNISGEWYYFDLNGKMQTGWVKSNGIWYYMDKNGVMKTGWIYDRGRWYYADSTGAMQTGVLKISGKTYYFNKSGVMQTGRVKINGTIYTFAYNGQAIGSRIPACDKEFDSNNNLVKPNNSGSNNGAVVKPPVSSDNGTTKPPTNSGNTGSNGGTVSGGSSNNGSSSNGTGNNNNTAGSGVSVSGLPEIPQKYSITVQSSAEQTILKLMNEKRAEAGLKPLTMDNTLLSVARYKSNHMIQNNYFDHTNPDGTNWTNWLKTIGYKYTATAENIAYNSYDPVELFNQWWNSSGHRKNMMNPSYTKVGIGVVYGNGKYMGTQEFSN